MAKKSASTANNANILGIVAWLLGILGAIIVLLVEKKDKVARWHAKQSFVAGLICLAWGIISLFLTMVPGIGIINRIIALGYMALLIVGIVNAAQGKSFDVPIIADWAKKVNF